MLALAWLLGVGVFFVVRDQYAFEALGGLTVPGLPRWATVGTDLKGLALLLTTLLGAALLGSFLLCQVSMENALENYLFSQALGLATLSYLVLTMGVLGLWYTGFLWSLWAVLLVLSIGWFVFPPRRTFLKSAATEIRNAWPAAGKLWLQVPLLLLVLTALMIAFVPEVFYDALVYHLGVPRLYLLAHKIFNVPNLHSKFPLTLQMLYVYGLALSDDLLPKLIHWATGCLLIFSFVACGKRQGRTGAGWLAAALFMSMPMTQMNWWTSSIDVGLSFFSFMAIYALINYCGTERGKQTPWLVLCGVFSGLSMASKYTALTVTVGILAGLLVNDWQRKTPLRSTVKRILGVALLAGIILAPWLIKNFFYTGNPVYPFLGKVFGSPGLNPKALDTFRSQNNGETPGTLLGWLALPWNLTFKGNWGALSFPGPLLLGLLPVPFLVKKESRPSWFWPLVVFIVVSLSGMLSVNRLLRYSMPALTGLSWLLAWSACTLMDQARPFFRKALTTCFSSLIVFNLLIGWVFIQKAYQPLDVLTGAEARREYLSYTHPGLDPYPATALFDSAQVTLPPGSKLMLIGDEKVADCRMPVIASGVFDEHPAVVWSRQAKTAEDIFAHFQKEGVTHFLFNFPEARRTYGYGYADWDDVSLGRFCRFWNDHVRLIEQQIVPEKIFVQSTIPLYLYAILPTKEAERIGKPTENPFLWLEQENIKKNQGAVAEIQFLKKIEDISLQQ